MSTGTGAPEAGQEGAAGRRPMTRGARMSGGPEGRDRWLALQVTEEEWALLSSAAAEVGWPPGAWVAAVAERAAGAGHGPPPRAGAAAAWAGLGDDLSLLEALLWPASRRAGPAELLRARAEAARDACRRKAVAARREAARSAEGGAIAGAAAAARVGEQGRRGLFPGPRSRSLRLRVSEGVLARLGELGEGDGMRRSEWVGGAALVAAAAAERAVGMAPAEASSVARARAAARSAATALPPVEESLTRGDGWSPGEEALVLAAIALDLAAAALAAGEGDEQ